MVDILLLGFYDEISDCFRGLRSPLKRGAMTSRRGEFQRVPMRRALARIVQDGLIISLF